MKLNKLKVKLIKIDGINVLHGKGILDTEKDLVEEKRGFFFKDKNTYKVDTKHIKRDKKGKALLFIDLKEGKSFNPHTQDNPNLKCQNCLQFLLQKKNWEARQTTKKIDKWTALYIFFAGIGFFFLITQIIGAFIK
ncbi:MAG: hypothetical protein ACE5JB_16485 [bacterium]